MDEKTKWNVNIYALEETRVPYGTLNIGHKRRETMIYTKEMNESENDYLRRRQTIPEDDDEHETVTKDKEKPPLNNLAEQ